jgi:V/A-type H+/Na+-transporting ATPase subunit D
MARLRLSKNALQQERGKLALYRKLLPSLELKRRLLTTELARARELHDELEARLAALMHAAGERLPMIARAEIPLNGLLRLTELRTHTENIAGVRVPAFESASFELKPYSYLTRPAWLDVLVEALREAALVRIRLRLARERREVLEIAVKRMTQRVNLFERVLIPRAIANIRRLQIFLGDLERDAVIRSKIAKRRVQERR